MQSLNHVAYYLSTHLYTIYFRFQYYDEFVIVLTIPYLTRDSMTLKELQNALGHDESTTTLDIYGDILADSMEKTANKIDDVFDKMNKEMEKIENEKIENDKASKNKKLGKVLQFRAR